MLYLLYHHAPPVTYCVHYKLMHYANVSTSYNNCICSYQTCSPHRKYSFYYAFSRYRLLRYNIVHDKCKICQSNIRTWNTAAEFVWTVSNKVVIKAVFQWTKNNDRSCVVHCNSNQPQYISPYKHAS